MDYIIQKFAQGGMHYLPVDDVTAAPLLAGGNKRVVLRAKGVELHAALQRSKESGYYIALGAPSLKKLGAKEGDRLDAAISRDEDPYQFVMPEELLEVLRTDPEADTVFHALTPGNQRGLMHVVTSVKSPEKRVERALRIAERIKAGVTSPMKVLARK
ncbi:YdeI/OmpD-associated family protein [Flaviaesturariibacter amylovorans]|uniref:DUF1905 domain-containing protein n=1 Tax=Flaviaesturariibacter amylovorans TaxID=1084520 RepID=A0ABP8HE07_9BACT